MTERWVQLVPGAKPGTANLVQYYRILTERNTTYNASNLPSLKNTQQKPTEEYITYEKLCQGKETHEVRKTVEHSPQDSFTLHEPQNS